ncbi:MAG: beta strand repeat-containing protein, partial [Luteolibacter sp.]
SLTLSGNNTYSGGTFLQQGTIIADSATALSSGDITFRGGTLQYTANTAGLDYGSQIVNSSSAINLNTNGQNVVLSNLGSGNTAGLDKQGNGTLSLAGTNTFGALLDVSSGTLVIDGGTTTANQVGITGNNAVLSIINGGTLNATGGNFDVNNGIENTLISIVGGASTSTLNLGTRDFNLLGYNPGNPARANKDMTLDGAGVAGSAVFIARDVAWGRSTRNSDLLLTNGALMNIRDMRIGSAYYDDTTAINNTVTIQGGSADSIMNVSQDFYVGHGDRPGASSNTATVNSGGQLNITRHGYVGDMNSSANTATWSTDNKLAVNGGTVSMNQLFIGRSTISSRTANANIVEVTGGGQLTTGGISYIGYSLNSGSQSNANTTTVSGTGSQWNANNKDLHVGYTNNAGGESSNNILTVGTGGTLTNVANLTVGSGAGTTTGNQLVVNGTLNATTVTINAGNSLSGSGTVGGTVTVLGAIGPGNSPGVMTFSDSLNLGSTAVTTMEIDGIARGTGYDGVDVTNALAYDGSLTLTLGTTFGAGNYTFDLFGFGSESGDLDSVTLAGNYSGSLSFDGDAWTLSSGTETWSFAQSTGDLNLTVIPEPSVALLGLLGALGLLVRRKR